MTKKQIELGWKRDRKRDRKRDMRREKEREKSKNETMSTEPAEQLD